MILVTGVGGKTGKAILRSLSRVESVCAFVHREEHVPVWKALGAQQVVIGDLQDALVPDSALQGARAVYHICPNMSRNETVIGVLSDLYATGSKDVQLPE